MTKKEIEKAQIEKAQKDFGIQIKEHLKRLKLSNNKAAKLSGLTAEQVGWIVNGKRNPTIESCIKLVNAIELQITLKKL